MSHMLVEVSIKLGEESPDIWQIHSTSLSCYFWDKVSGLRAENGTSKAIMEKVRYHMIHNTVQYCIVRYHCCGYESPRLIKQQGRAR